MTSPITPDQSLHHDPTAAIAEREALQASYQALQRIFAGLPQQIVQGLANAILRALGLGNFVGTFDGLLTAVENALRAGIGLGFQALVDTIIQAIKGNLTDSGNTVPQLLAALNSMFRGFSPLGQLRVDAAHLLSAAHIANLNPQLLINPGFDTAASLIGTSFTWDGTVGHTNLGSAKATANGASTLTLLSSPVAVWKNDALNMSTYVEWSGVTTSGSSPAPITISAAAYLAGSPVSSTVLASETSPGASSGWVQLSGTYTVPAGVDTVYLVFTVNTTMTAGSVWFDDASVAKAGVLAAGDNLVLAWQNTLTTLFGSNTIVGQLLRGLLPSILGGADLLADVQAIVDKAVNALNITGVNHTLATFLAALQAIPFPNITSVFGLTHIGADIQALLDAGAQALAGGAGSGNPLAAWGLLLQNIPHTNVLVPPNPGSGTITHDAAANATPVTGTLSSLSASWNHTCGATANYLIVRTAFYSSALFNGWHNSSVTYNGIALTLVANETAGACYGQIWALQNPPTGSALSVNVSVVNNFGTAVYIIQGSSDSYVGVSSVGTLTGTTGSGSSPSVTLASATNNMVLNLLAVTDSSSETLSSYSQTSRYNSGSTLSSAVPIYQDMIAGDAAGAASVTFSATASPTSGDNWLAIAVNLTPLSSSTIGSGGFMYRNSATAVNAANTGATGAVLPASFFDNSSLATTDLTASLTSGQFTVTQAGHYHVSMGVDIAVAGNYCPIIFHNTAQALWGGFVASTQMHVGGTLSLAVGDTVQAGYFSGSAITGAFVGESTGSRTYLRIGLANRSLF